MGIVGTVAADAIVPMLVNYGIAVSLVQVIARKHGYEVDDAHEATAYGLCNFIPSFFQCYSTGKCTAVRAPFSYHFFNENFILIL